MTAKTLSLLLAAALTAGASAPPAAAQFEGETTVVVVEVPVQVLHDGQPVAGLTADDFAIEDRGREQEITGFEVVDLGEYGAAAGERPVTEIPASGRRHFLLLFDLSLSDPESIARARASARRLVAGGLHPADLVAVATYSESRGLRLVLNFTPNRDQVEVAVSTLGLAEPAARIEDPLALMLGDSSQIGADGPVGGGQAPSEIEVMTRDLKTMSGRVARDQQKNRVLALADSLTGLARMMNAIDGRKHVVFLSEGFDSEILVGTEDPERQAEIRAELEQGNFWQEDAVERFGDTQASGALERMLEEFRRADCAIQTVDIGGIDAGPEADTGLTRNEGLFRMARGTGGELYQNYNEIDQAMTTVLERTSVTYVLAFQPRDLELDGSFHRLRVRLKDQTKGVRLVHRPGYYPPKPFAQQSAVERQLATASEIVGGSTGGSFLTAVVAAAFPAPGDLAYVPVLIEVDGASLLSGHQGETLVTELYAYALGADGEVEDFFARRLGLDTAGSRQALLEGGFKYGGHLDLGPGQYLVRALVRNAMTGESSLSETSVSVPDHAAGESMLLPPLFPEPAGKWLFGRESEQEQRADVGYPFMLGEQPFMPAARPALQSAGATIGLAGYNLGEGSLALSMQLYSADGVALDGGTLELVERVATAQQGFEWIVARIEPGAVPAGEYLLVVEISNLATGRQLTSSTGIVVAG
jgi:VWFA-related protein